MHPAYLETTVCSSKLCWVLHVYAGYMLPNQICHYNHFYTGTQIYCDLLKWISLWFLLPLWHKQFKDLIEISSFTRHTQILNINSCGHITVSNLFECRINKFLHKSQASCKVHSHVLEDNHNATMLTVGTLHQTFHEHIAAQDFCA